MHFERYHSLLQLSLPNITTEFEPYLDNLVDILELDRSPHILSVYGLGITEHAETIISCCEDALADIPPRTQGAAGFYDFSENVVLLSSIIYKQSDYGGIQTCPLTYADRLAILAHELRHASQVKERPDLYLSSQSISSGNFRTDRAEVDADAFALAYVFSEKTDFKKADLPIFSVSTDTLYSDGFRDRLERAGQLASAYRFGRFRYPRPKRINRWR